VAAVWLVFGEGLVFFAQQVFVLRTMVFVFRQIYGKANSAGCLENDFCYAGKTLPPSRSRIDARIFDAQLMSCCNLREYLPAKKDIKEFKNINEAQDALPPAGFGAGVFADEDNEEDVPCDAEMFEAASILSAMQMTPMINCDPDEDRAEESDEPECDEYDSGDDQTEDYFVGMSMGMAGDT